MIGEVDLFGVLLPPLLAWLGIALVLSTLVRRALAWAGLYRYVWHRPLFDFALLILMTGLVSLTMQHFF
jgi:hypothetical protein